MLTNQITLRSASQKIGVESIHGLFYHFYKHHFCIYLLGRISETAGANFIANFCSLLERFMRYSAKSKPKSGAYKKVVSHRFIFGTPCEMRTCTVCSIMTVLSQLLFTSSKNLNPHSFTSVKLNIEPPVCPVQKKSKDSVGFYFWRCDWILRMTCFVESLYCVLSRVLLYVAITIIF